MSPRDGRLRMKTPGSSLVIRAFSEIGLRGPCPGPALMEELTNRGFILSVVTQCPLRDWLPYSRRGLPAESSSPP